MSPLLGWLPSRDDPRLRVVVGAILTLCAAAIELKGSWLGGSLFLRADAVHLTAHMGVYAGLLFPEQWRIRRFPLALTFVLLVIAGIAATLMAASVRGLIHPRAVEASTLLLSLCGLGANLITAWLLNGISRRRLSFRAAVFHELSDGGLTVAALIGAALIQFEHWMFIDPLLSLAVGVWLFAWTVSRLLQTSDELRPA